MPPGIFSCFLSIYLLTNPITAPYDISDALIHNSEFSDKGDVPVRKALVM